MESGVRKLLRASYWILFLTGFLLSLGSNLVADIWRHSKLLPDAQYQRGLNSLVERTPEKIEKTLFPKPDELKHRIWVLTTTKYSLSQPPRLVRLAQALFPVRHFITWVIVEREDFGGDANIIGNHKETLKQLIIRFGISFYILPLNLELAKSNGDNVPDAVAKQTGLQWILKNVQQGVLMIAPENYAFDYRLFEQIRYTKTVSAWPVALKKKHGLTSPIVGKDGVLKGYFVGSGIRRDPTNYLENDMLMEFGGYALNINFVRRNVNMGKLWHLAMNSFASMLSLGLSLSDVHVLPDNCTQIYAWRTFTRDHPWPKRIMLHSNYAGTNIEILMRRVFGMKIAAEEKTTKVNV